MKKLFYLLLIATISVSCASQTKKEIEAEKNSMPQIKTRAEMISKMNEVLEHAKGITPEQKEKFANIHADVLVKNQEIEQDIRKLKVILFEGIMADKYDNKKVFETRKQLEKLYKQRLDLMFDAYSKVSKVLGRNKTDFFSDRINEHVFQEIHFRY
ncbi:hypothetical protein M899_0357 [Bacteriovorax sp. BSW11_IV]|uniref:Spy/CpxP family protein refolding chaperone n=1 Tax=Bacteriovorax sp. BSW11_IV TaxID=1353529 RepID=UPI00038A2D52|nr:hypothetical protein [Bacteriovorax sp. BSW11_IV]EQC50223.1 hypothetical protein M899_0357 [Bacteriovorax sp. BSW11_IV]